MATPPTITPEMSTLKTRLKTTWESGDYGVFAKYLEKGARVFRSLHVGQMFKVIGGDEATCRQRFGADVKDLKITRYMHPFEYPFAPARVVDFFIEYYGPMNRAYASLKDDGRKAMLDDVTALWTRNNVATDGTTRVLAEYVEVIGTRS